MQSLASLQIAQRLFLLLAIQRKLVVKTLLSYVQDKTGQNKTRRIFETKPSRGIPYLRTVYSTVEQMSMTCTYMQKPT